MQVETAKCTDADDRKRHHLRLFANVDPFLIWVEGFAPQPSRPQIFHKSAGGLTETFGTEKLTGSDSRAFAFAAAMRRTQEKRGAFLPDTATAHFMHGVCLYGALPQTPAPPREPQDFVLSAGKIQVLNVYRLSCKIYI